MRILVLTIEYPPIGGGASPVAHEINRHYFELGHEVHVITMSYKGLPAEEIVDGVIIHRVRCLRSQKHLSTPIEHISFLVQGRRYLKSFLLRQSFDICHVHFILPTGILAKWMKHRFGIPYIITAHGSDVPGFNTDRFTFLHHFTPGIIRSIFQQCSMLVAPSQFLVSLIVKVVRDAEEKLIVIPNGINTGYFIPGNKKPIILSAGRLLARKGFQHLIEAVSKENLGYEVHIAGDGPMMKKLKVQSVFSKTPVHFHGWLDNRDERYKLLFESASIFCLMSIRENASIALMEALSAGCAVVTTNTSGCPETVGDAGICIDPGQADQLAHVLKTLTLDDQYRTSLMEAGRKRAIELYQWPSIAAKYNVVLHSIVRK